MKINNKAKQYITLLAFTAVAVVIYILYYQMRICELVSIDVDKSIDPFIQGIIDNNGIFVGDILSGCNYNIQNIVMLLLGTIFGNMYIGINLYYIISFFAISVSMYWCLQKFDISPMIAMIISLLVSMLPYHINRGEGQIVSSSFYLAPLFIGMVYGIIYKSEHKGIEKKYLLMSCIVPFIDVRLSFMMMILAVVLTVHRGDKEISRIMVAYIIPCTILAIFAGMLTGIIGWDNLEQDINVANQEGLRIFDMLMPVRYHIIGRFHDFRCEYDNGFLANGESGINTLGFLFSIGFICNMFCLFFEKDNTVIKWLAWINILVILFSNIQGFNILIEYAGLHIGYWDRMGIFIIINSAVTIGIIADRIKERISKNAIVYPTYICVGLLAFLELLLRIKF